MPEQETVAIELVKYNFDEAVNLYEVLPQL
jgi:hypothetical protein